MPQLQAKIATIVFVSFALFAPAFSAAESPTFTGVATCASSNCHGGVNPRGGTNVLQNEYTTWFRHDAHSRAYQTLLSEESKKIGSHLGIADPSKSKQCLICHSTLIPEENQGKKFRISDGVGCESCHGGAGDYLKTHTEVGRSHEQNLKDGLRNLYSLEVRNQVCLECHQGNDSQFVNHRLIGAGHPRLTFELDTFSILQPNHWNVDEDYIKRKGNYSPAKAWLVGQAFRAKEMVRTLRSDKRSKFGVMPELSNYYCYNCHHNLADKQWKKREYFGTPGELHLNISSLIILREGLREVDNNLSEMLNNQISELHKLHQQGVDKEHLKGLETLVDTAIVALQKNLVLSENNTKSILRRIVSYSVNTPYLPYEIAEQCAMAISALRAELDPAGKIYQSQIDQIFDTLKEEANFKPEAFTAAVKKLASAM